MAATEHDQRSEDSYTYIIRGGKPISGTVTSGGNKNAALPMIAATVLAEEKVCLNNVPAIRDVQVMLDIFFVNFIFC